MPTVDVPFLSEDYFALAASRPDVGAALALGARVIVIVDGAAYETVGQDEAGDRIEIPSAVAPDAEPTTAGPVTIPPLAVRDARSRLVLPCTGIALPLGILLLPLARGRSRL